MAEHRYDPSEIEPRWQQVWADERTWEVSNDDDGAREVLRAGDAALPQRRAAHRPSQGLLGGRRRRALPPSQRAPGPAPDGLRRVRPAGREPRDQHRPAPARVDRRGDRGVPAPVPRVGDLDRLDARVRHPRPALLPLDPVDLPAAVRGAAWPTARRPRSSGAPTTQTVLANEQVIDGRCERCGAEVEVRQLEQWFFRITDYADRLVDDLETHRLARARQDHAAQLDRSLGGRRGHVPLRGCRPRPADRLPGVHDPPGHAVRRDVLRHGARAPRRGAAGGRHRARGGGPRLRQPRGRRVGRGARRRRQAEDRRLAGPHRRPTRSTASGCRCTSPTTC